MTQERQNISEDFYSGNYKEIAVTVYQDIALTTPKNLSGAEISYSLFTDNGRVVLRKSSANGAGEINITDPNNGGVIVYLMPPDTANVNGTFRHQMNVVDASGYEETVLTGVVNIFKSYAKRFRSSSISAYLQGGTI